MTQGEPLWRIVLGAFALAEQTFVASLSFADIYLLSLIDRLPSASLASFFWENTRWKWFFSFVNKEVGMKKQCAAPKKASCSRVTVHTDSYSSEQGWRYSPMLILEFHQSTCYFLWHYVYLFLLNWKKKKNRYVLGLHYLMLGFAHIVWLWKLDCATHQYWFCI